MKIDIYHEIELINQFFRSYKIGAETNDRRTRIAGKAYAVFGLSLRPGARISNIERHLRELAEVLSVHRNRPTPVRLRQLPLALEVPHPHPEPLIPDPAQALPAHTMLLGKSYAYDGGEQEETVDLTYTPHVLIAGTTGSGKSKLLTVMLWSLCRYTSPASVRLVLVDLKNEDLVPFAGLPHVEAFANSPEKADAAIWQVLREKERRVEEGAGNFQRMVLVIDELAEMAQIDDAIKRLSSVLGIGRSKSINVIAATQKPLSSIVGSVNKANFTLRLVGRTLSSDDSKVAGGQSGLGAEFLPGRGAFLRVGGAEVRRLQSYFIDDVEEWTQPLHALWFEQMSFVLPVEMKGQER